MSDTPRDQEPRAQTPWEQVVRALEQQGHALRSGRGTELEATNLELERVCGALSSDSANERELVVRARSLARENALLLMAARDQVARALSLFQSQARTGLA